MLEARVFGPEPTRLKPATDKQNSCKSATNKIAASLPQTEKHLKVYTLETRVFGPETTRLRPATKKPAEDLDI